MNKDNRAAHRINAAQIIVSYSEQVDYRKGDLAFSWEDMMDAFAELISQTDANFDEQEFRQAINERIDLLRNKKEFEG